MPRYSCEVKRRATNLLSVPALAIAVSLAMLTATALAQMETHNLRTRSNIIYHNGPVMTGTSHVYLIWYGCWTCGFPGSNPDTQAILTELVTSLGSTPYFNINTLYPNVNGHPPNGQLIYGGAVQDSSYSHDNELNALAIQQIVAKHLAATNLPLDAAGIYIVIGSSDISSNATGFCAPNTPPHHGYAEFGATQFKYAFIGNAARCPTRAAPQFFVGPGPVKTPNGNLAADAMASSLAHALDAIVTNPLGTGWFDRCGLENAEKCLGTFGQTYITPNGARANMRLGQRDYLIQQNWVNVRPRGYCGLSLP